MHHAKEMFGAPILSVSSFKGLAFHIYIYMYKYLYIYTVLITMSLYSKAGMKKYAEF